MTAENRDLVRKGYDLISHAYRDDAGENALIHEDLLADLLPHVEAGSSILDLGCGNGVPVCRFLADRGFKVTGLDFSQVQVERARKLVLNASFVQADMVDWDCPPGSFDAIVSFYVLIHIPREDQRKVLTKVARWLRPEGHFLAIVGAQEWTGTEEYHGTQMYWDHPGTEVYIEWFRDAGLQPLSHRFIPEGDAGHSLILARRTS